MRGAERTEREADDIVQRAMLQVSSKEGLEGWETS